MFNSENEISTETEQCWMQLRDVISGQEGRGTKVTI